MRLYITINNNMYIYTLYYYGIKYKCLIIHQQLLLDISKYNCI